MARVATIDSSLKICAVLSTQQTHPIQKPLRAFVAADLQHSGLLNDMKLRFQRNENSLLY